MRKSKFYTIALATSSLLFASCTKPSTALSEQYFEQPTISENVMTVELLHKDESKWLDVVKQKATGVGIKATEYKASSKDPKNEMDVYLRRNDVYNDAGEVKSPVQTEVDEYDLQYLVSTYYAVTTESGISLLTDDSDPDAVEDSSTELETSENISSPKDTSTPAESSSSVDDISTSEEKPSKDADPYFPISYGKDALAAKFSFNVKKFVDKLNLGSEKLISLRVAMQKYETKAAFLGSETFVLASVEDSVLYSLPVKFSFNGKSTDAYLIPGKAVSAVKDYFSILDDMLGTDAKFEASYKNAVGETVSEEVDLETTKFVDTEGATADGEFNINGKKDVTIQLKSKK